MVIDSSWLLVAGAAGWFVDMQVKNWRGTAQAQGEQGGSLAALWEKVNGLDEQVKHFASDRKDHQAQAEKAATFAERVDQMDIRMREGFASMREDLSALADAVANLLKPAKQRTARAH